MLRQILRFDETAINAGPFQAPPPLYAPGVVRQTVRKRTGYPPESLNQRIFALSNYMVNPTRLIPPFFEALTCPNPRLILPQNPKQTQNQPYPFNKPFLPPLVTLPQTRPYHSNKQAPTQPQPLPCPFRVAPNTPLFFK